MRVWLLLSAVALLAAPGAAAPKPDKPSSPDDLRMLQDFSRCIVLQSRGQAIRVLGLDYRTDAYRRSLGNLASGIRPCRPFNRSLRLSGILLAGGLAEALLPRALAGQSLAARAALDPSKPALPARDEGEYLGLCVVRSMPDQVAALLATAPASTEEKQVVGEISGKLAPCVREGVSATLNRPGLRALLALSAYRIVTQDPAPARAAGS